MSQSRFDLIGCLLTAFGMALVILFIITAVDTWADRRDYHHIQDLQRRVGQIESERR